MKNPRKQVARFLDADELALTGCRRGEVLNLRWRNIGANALNLEDTKTGSRAGPLGEILPLVGKLLWHRWHETTAGYAQLADEHLVEAAEKIGKLIAAAMVDGPENR